MLFVCSPDDTDQIAACLATGEEVITVDWPPGRADYARKINHAYRTTKEPWLFCGADDLRFNADWDRLALQVGTRTGAGVVGTQDMGNALVKRGATATHPLVRRAYIEEFGGTFDRTGDIYCELYSHQYIDLELCETAKSRNRWAFAKRSIVEHLHPNWKKGEWDPTYEKAFADVQDDRTLYVRRQRQYQTLRARNRSGATL